MVEPWFVVPVVVGSSPIDHPRFYLNRFRSEIKIRYKSIRHMILFGYHEKILVGICGYFYFSNFSHIRSNAILQVLVVTTIYGDSREDGIHGNM